VHSFKIVIPGNTAKPHDAYFIIMLNCTRTGIK